MDSTNYYIVFYKYAKILTHETACEIKVSYTHLQPYLALHKTIVYQLIESD
jgi:hypothetical protein